MAVKIGLILCLVVVFNSAEPGSERGHEAGSETYGNISPMNIRQRKLTCSSLGGQCGKKKQTCPIWLPLEKPYGRPYCRRRQRCCYRDSCPNPIFEYFNVCATCSSPEDALAFVIELWGQPSTNPRNTTVFDGHNITYDISQDYNQPSCQSNFVDTWDCFQNSDGYWTECLKRNGLGPGVCSSNHALKNGHLFPEIACYFKEPPTTTDPLVPGPPDVLCPVIPLNRFMDKHVCGSCNKNDGSLACQFTARARRYDKDVYVNDVYTIKTRDLTSWISQSNSETCITAPKVTVWRCYDENVGGEKEWNKVRKLGDDCYGLFDITNGHWIHTFC